MTVKCDDLSLDSHQTFMLGSPSVSERSFMNSLAAGLVGADEHGGEK
jgi:hypothetical protein